MTTVNKFIIGVTVGAIFGVLYAPNKGSITRRKLNRTGNDLRNSFNDFKDAINEKLDNLKEDVDDLTYHEMEIIEGEAGSKPESWQSGN